MIDRATPKSLTTRLSSLVSERGLVVERDIAYGAHVRQTLDIYRAGRESADAALILFFYGGGWTSGDRATYGFVGAGLAASGVTTIIADYRLFPEVQFPAFCDDAALAYAWVQTNIAGNGRRPVVLMGHSAGAHIASLVAFDKSYLASRAHGAPEPTALIGLSGPYGFDPTSWPTTKDVFATAPTADIARPVVQALNGGPPTLLIHGGADELVDPVAVEMLAHSLRMARTSVQGRIYPGIGHSGLILAFAQPLRWRAPVLGDVVAFVGSL